MTEKIDVALESKYNKDFLTHAAVRVVIYSVDLGSESLPLNDPRVGVVYNYLQSKLRDLETDEDFTHFLQNTTPQDIYSLALRASGQAPAQKTFEESPLLEALTTPLPQSADGVSGSPRRGARLSLDAAKAVSPKSLSMAAVLLADSSNNLSSEVLALLQPHGAAANDVSLSESSGPEQPSKTEVAPEDQIRRAIADSSGKTTAAKKVDPEAEAPPLLDPYEKKEPVTPPSIPKPPRRTEKPTAVGRWVAGALLAVVAAVAATKGWRGIKQSDVDRTTQNTYGSDRSPLVTKAAGTIINETLGSMTKPDSKLGLPVVVTLRDDYPPISLSAHTFGDGLDFKSSGEVGIELKNRNGFQYGDLVLLYPANNEIVILVNVASEGVKDICSCEGNGCYQCFDLYSDGPGTDNPGTVNLSYMAMYGVIDKNGNVTNVRNRMVAERNNGNDFDIARFRGKGFYENELPIDHPLAQLMTGIHRAHVSLVQRNSLADGEKPEGPPIIYKRSFREDPQWVASYNRIRYSTELCTSTECRDCSREARSYNSSNIIFCDNVARPMADQEYKWKGGKIVDSDGKWVDCRYQAHNDPRCKEVMKDRQKPVPGPKKRFN